MSGQLHSPAKYCQNDQLKETDMGGESSINGRAQKCLQNFIRQKLKEIIRGIQTWMAEQEQNRT
jgi:hypothetical protein